MGDKPRRKASRKAHRFGGDWTATKLGVLADYLRAYTTALKNQPFKIAYIDAFAGTGYRSLREHDRDRNEVLLFPDLAGAEPQDMLDGSALIALKTEPRFHKYIFIERSPTRRRELHALKDEFPELAADIDIQKGDANKAIRAMCKKNWKTRRAVLFLDPYGMQVEWSTIEAIARTRAIDLWILFPLGIGVNRLLPRSGNVPDSWRRRLDVLLGTKDWYEAFYKVETALTLWKEPETQVAKASQETIGRYFNDRLRTVFAGVASNPLVLLNSANCPLYLLCFAVGNDKGAKVALNIANHLLKS